VPRRPDQAKTFESAGFGAMFWPEAQDALVCFPSSVLAHKKQGRFTCNRRRNFIFGTLAVCICRPAAGLVLAETSGKPQDSAPLPCFYAAKPPWRAAAGISPFQSRRKPSPEDVRRYGAESRGRKPIPTAAFRIGLLQPPTPGWNPAANKSERFCFQPGKIRGISNTVLCSLRPYPVLRRRHVYLQSDCQPVFGAVGRAKCVSKPGPGALQ